MASYRDSAVVLRKVDYSETSQVIVMFTREHGKVRMIGKGTKRSTRTRFSPGIDLLQVGQVVFYARPDRTDRLATLSEWKQTAILGGLRERLDRLHAAEYCAEITAHLTEDGDPHPSLFDALVTLLQELSASSQVIVQSVMYQRALLAAAGSWPRFDTCVTCGRTSELSHFSSHEGGMICRHCEPVQTEKREVAPSTLEEVCGTRWPPRNAAFSLLNYHLAHLIGHAPLLGDRLVPPVQQRGT